MELLGESDASTAGPYRLVAELGQGGMGRVLLGVAPDGRLVAVKLVRAQFTEDAGFRSRFRREVEASRRVSGAYTAAVLDADADAPQPWLASVFVPGPPLSEVVATAGLLPPQAALRLAAGLATALAGIHRAGLIHRDLKPSNVLLAADGPRVIDFGVARATDGETGSSITHTGWLVGSPAFMSPEQAEGRELGPASDVFSLGVVLVQACTGTSPFAGPSAPQTLYNVVHTEPDLSSVPAELRDLVTRCLAKDPSRRPDPAGILDSVGPLAPAVRPWPDAVHALIEEQQAEIARFVEPAMGPGTVRLIRPQPEPAPAPDPAPEPAPAPAPKSGPAPIPSPAPEPAPESRRAPEPAPAPGTADLPTETAVPPAVALAAPPERRRPGRRAVLLGALGALGTAAAVAVPLANDRRAGSSADGASGGSASRSASPSASASPSRSLAPSTSPSSTPGPPSRFTASERLDSPITALEFSRDGRLIAVGDMDGGVHLRDGATLATVAVLGATAGTGVDNVTGSLAFSPDGRLLAAVDDHATLTLWDVASRKTAAVIHADPKQKDDEMSSLAFSPDGRAVAYAGNFMATIWDVRSRQRIATYVERPDHQEFAVDGAVSSAVFTGDGRTLVVATNQGRLRFWDIRRRTLRATVQGPEQGLYGLTLSPDGKTLAARSQNDLRLYRTATRTALETLTDAGDVLGAVAFSRDGGRIAATERGGPVHIWSTDAWTPLQVLDDRIEEARPTLTEVASSQPLCNGLSFSPDGRFLAESLDRHVALWRLD
ncbi:WD40 repeat domain-containing serine/threonine protein kinase [Streptomyces sp. NPDC053493]|uniref:WD40 repeat domain-containing serine/threonine protein kinase n=1 Tax=Streptomyces sp. NPDC053493 TaxID=3365705 RepID=UPI0037CEF86E